MEPIGIISTYLFPSNSFRNDIDNTSITNGRKAIVEWAEQRFRHNNILTSEIVSTQSSQLMEFDSDRDIDNDDDYVTLSLEEMMESCPSKKVKIINQIQIEQKENEVSLESAINDFPSRFRDME